MVDEIRKGEIMNCIRVMVFIGIIFILTAIVIFCICYLKKIIIKIYNKWEKRGMLLQNIAYPTGGIYKDINCKREIYFFFSSANRSSRFAINLRELLSCLEDAEVQGDIPELSTEWWNEIGKIYPEFRKEVEKETDDISSTLQQGYLYKKGRIIRSFFLCVYTEIWESNPRGAVKVY